MTIKFFAECRTAEELKKAYLHLVKKNHPDNGGDPEVMKAINAEYDVVFQKLKNTHSKKDGTTWEAQSGSKYESSEVPEKFREMVFELLKHNVTIEIIGCFVWVSGDTKPCKELLKKWGFRWHSKKKVWYRSPENYHRFGDAEYSLEQIRSMYQVRATMYGHEEEKESNKTSYLPAV